MTDRSCVKSRTDGDKYPSLTVSSLHIGHFLFPERHVSLSQSAPNIKTLVSNTAISHQHQVQIPSYFGFYRQESCLSSGTSLNSHYYEASQYPVIPECSENSSLDKVYLPEYERPPSYPDSEESSTTPVKSIRNSLIAILFCIIGTFLYTFGSVFYKFSLVNTPYFVISKNVFGCLAAHSLLSKNQCPYYNQAKPKQTVLILLRGFFGALSALFMILGIHYTTLADALTLYNTSPAFTMILAFFILKEKPDKMGVVSVLITICGVALVARPAFIFGGDQSISATGIVCCLTSGLLNGLCTCLTSKMCGVFHYSVFLTYIFLFGIISGLCIIPLFDTSEVGCYMDRVYPFVAACFDLVGAIFVINAYRWEKASILCVIFSLDVVFAFLLQNIFFPGELIPLTTIIGAALVFASTVSMSVKQFVRAACGNKARKAPVT